MRMTGALRSLLFLLFVALQLANCKSWGKFWLTELSYATSPLVLTQGVAMTAATPTLPGSARSCSATPGLPDGLTLADDCTISGAPTKGQGTLPYRITADIGSDTVSGDLRIRVLFQPRFAYVANVADNNVTTFSINSTTGALTLIGNYPAGSGARFVLRDPSGKYLYVANRTGVSISAYAINQTTGALAQISGSPFATSNAPYSLATDPEGRFLYVGHEDAAVAAVSAYTISSTTGSITAISGSPFAAATGATPVSVYVSPDGKHLYAGSSQSGVSPNTFGYEINQQTGALTPLAGSPFGALQNGISVFVHPSGKYVYYAQYSPPTAAVGYTRDTITGALTLISGSPFSAGLAPGFVSGDINGNFIFVANSGDAVGTSGVSAFTVGATGALTAVPGSPFTTGKNAIGIAFDETSRFVYIIGSGETNPTADPVYAYTLNTQTGVISLVGTYTAGVDATGIVVAGSNP